MRLIDLTGQRFGRLVAVSIAEKTKKHTFWLCQCDCGNVKIVRGQSLTTGNTKSCGCYQKDFPNNTKHGGSKTSLYRRWRHIIRRCEVPQEPCYPHYGGRGIALCDEWHDFGIFQKWAYENGYREDLTIDRINVNGNYEPSNCRWVDMFVQASNKTNNRSVSQYLPDGTYVATYKTLADARRATGTCEPNITKVCKGERPLANGFIWKYSEWKGETA